MCVRSVGERGRAVYWAGSRVKDIGRCVLKGRQPLPKAHERHLDYVQDRQWTRPSSGRTSKWSRLRDEGHNLRCRSELGMEAVDSLCISDAVNKDAVGVAKYKIW